MPYNTLQTEKLKALLASIESNKPHKNAAPTFRDSEALAQIRTIVEEKLSATADADAELLEDSIAILRYLADSYEAMNKVAYAIKIYKLLLQTETEAIRRYGTDKSHLKDDFYSALRSNNYYGKNKCDDLSDIVIQALGSEKTEAIVNEVYRRYPQIKRDSVELTDEYLSVIDSVERKTADMRKTDLCHEYWSLKKQFLASCGIKWKSPFELNPDMIFD